VTAGACGIFLRNAQGPGPVYAVMAAHVVGVFDDPDLAQTAVEDLVESGISVDQVSVVLAPDGIDPAARADGRSNKAAEGAATGLASGAVFGGILGLVASAGLVLLPVGLAVAGPLAGMLAGGAAGAAAGGVIGGLIGLGLPADEARTVAETLQRGGAMVVVRCEPDQIATVEDILDCDGAVDVRERTAALKSGGWFPDDALSDDDWHEVRSKSKAPSPGEPTYEAYQFGYRLAGDPRFDGMDWSAAEADVREAWEAQSSQPWEEHREFILAGWNRAHLRATIIA
jgi:hypothetical protein